MQRNLHHLLSTAPPGQAAKLADARQSAAACAQFSFAIEERARHHPQVDQSAEVTQPVSVRAAEAADVEQIRALAIGNGMFAPEDMADFDDGLNGYLTGALDGHRWLVATCDGDGLEGAAYYAPEPFGDRVWNLYFLAVDPSRHRRGAGTALVEHVERALRVEGDQSARVLIVETSSGAAYEGARRFYARRGFDREAVIREFYGPGHDKVVFWKSLF